MAEPRLIYRIENDNGDGPFIGWAYGPGFDADVYNDNLDRYPTPATDPGIGNDRYKAALRTLGEEVDPEHLWAVGCGSPDQLRYWFNADACKTLADLGYAYTVWRCPPERAIVGQFQAVFDRALAECIERNPACALWAESLPLAA